MQKCYTTKQIAELAGIHVNTVRFYEKIGFLTKPERRENGYRVYTGLQLEQCRLIRRAMKAEVLQNGLREKAVEIVCLCAALDYDAALTAAEEYGAMIDNEIKNAKAAITAVENMLSQNEKKNAAALTRREAAGALRVTTETLRTWERSGLLCVKRSENGYRAYDAADMERLNIIRTLRCANYSLSAILRLLSGLDNNEVQSVEAALNTPDAEDDIISVCDRLIDSLNNTRSDADELKKIIEEMKNPTVTHQASSLCYNT